MKNRRFYRRFCSKNVYFLHGRRTINRLLLHYLLLLYHNIFLLSSILYDFFGIISNFFLRFQRAPCAAPRFPFTLQGRWLGFAVPILALSKKGIRLLPFRPITPHIRDVLFSLLFLRRRFARLRLYIIFGNGLYHFW